jgi:hypothetical protein
LPFANVEEDFEYSFFESGKPSDDLAPGTLNSILKQSGLKDQH